MLPTKLILFDGLPGCGKSTQAGWLAEQLQRHDLAARWYEEGDVEHPLNWFDHWWLPDFDLAPYLDNLPDSMQRSLDRWRQFVDVARHSDTITTLDGWPFQNSANIFLMGDASPDVLQDYAQQVRVIAAPLSPVVIYFDQPDPRQALRRILDIRGPDFERDLFHNMSRFPFCQSRDRADFDCVVTLWQANRALMQQLLPGFTPHQITIDITQQSWAACRQQILDLMGLEPLQE